MNTITQALLAATTTVQVHDDLAIMKFQFRNLNMIAYEQCSGSNQICQRFIERPELPHGRGRPASIHVHAKHGPTQRQSICHPQTLTARSRKRI